MRTLHITLRLTIDEIGKVKLGTVGFHYQGCNDATLFKTEISGDDVAQEEEVTTPAMKMTTTPSQIALLALAKLGFSDEEASALAASIGEKRITDVAAWIERKNGVGSPKKLAEKLFKLG